MIKINVLGRMSSPLYIILSAIGWHYPRSNRTVYHSGAIAGARYDFFIESHSISPISKARVKVFRIEKSGCDARLDGNACECSKTGFL